MPDAAPIEIGAARSFLFVPADRPERFDKACAAGADVVIIDLEDAVAPESRAGARESLRTWLAAGGSAAVRVNAIGTPDHDLDIALLAASSGVRAIVVAKAEDPDALAQLARTSALPVVALIETATGILRAPEIARAEGVVRLAFGHVDFALDLGAEPTREAMLAARSALVLGSRAAGLPGPVDGVTVALQDPEAIAGDIAHARDLGMTGKLLIHPSQVVPTHEGYRPGDDQVRWAREVLAAVEQHGEGAIRVAGELVDRPVIDRALRIVAQSESTAA